MSSEAGAPARWLSRLQEAQVRAKSARWYQTTGRVVRATGLVIEAVGVDAPIGSICRIDGAGTGSIEAELVGFSGERSYLMPMAQVAGLTPGCHVAAEADSGARYPIGDLLLGRVLDGLGNPLDGGAALDTAEHARLTAEPLNPLRRAPIDAQIDVGVRTINALLSIGRGQRMGLFAGSGVGKSVLLGMMARYTDADRIVVGLIGERGREVQDFIDNILGKAGLARSVVVAAPADTSPLQRLHGADYAARIAEHFRAAGHHVLLIMDSLTRYAMAQREIALAVGEAPATKGYPPSVFAKLPALVERAGNAEKGGGSITGFYTVLTEGDDLQDPIADAARAILDGHIVLSRQLADAGHYPAIDIEASVSRVLPSLVSIDALHRIQALRNMIALYQRNRDIISVGAYTPGHDAQLDKAVAHHDAIEAFLTQDLNERADVSGSNVAFESLMTEMAAV